MLRLVSVSRRACVVAVPALMIGLLVATGPASAMPQDLGGKAWQRIPTRQKVIALTFDAGGGSGGVPKILRTLRKFDVPATFFLTGRWARQFPAQVSRMAAGGYVLGNHTDTHRKVSTLSDSQLRSQLRSTNRSVRKAAGRGTKPWFRFPYGAHTPNDIARVNALGYACIQWTVDTLGWMGTSGGQSVNSVVQHVIDQLQPGEIILMHVGQHPTDGSTLDADALASVIRAVQARGYHFTTVRALLPAPAAPMAVPPTPSASGSPS